MYPQRELIHLAERRAALHLRIRARRVIIAHSAARVVQPLELFDRLYERWRKISPLIKLTALPLAFLFKRKLLPGTSLWQKLMEWGPVVFRTVRQFTQV